MSCNCGCHEDKPPGPPEPSGPPASGWRRLVPLIVGVALVGALIAGAMLKDRGTTTTPGEPRSIKTGSAARG